MQANKYGTLHGITLVKSVFIGLQAWHALIS